MFVLCFYTVWIVLPFKILILTSALASVDQNLYKAAKVDGTSSMRIFTKITLPMISPMIFYLVITGFIGAFKAYSDSVASVRHRLKCRRNEHNRRLRVRYALWRRRRLPIVRFSCCDHLICDRTYDHLHQSARQQKARTLFVKEVSYGKTNQL